MSKKTNIVLLLVAIGIAMVAVSLFAVPGNVFLSSITMTATEAGPNTMKATVTQSSRINIRDKSGISEVRWEGDSDLMITKEACDVWDGEFLGGDCDIRRVPEGLEVVSNNLIFKGRQVEFVGTNGKTILIKIDAEIAGCSEADLFNDLCAGKVGGSIELRRPPECPPPGPPPCDGAVFSGLPDCTWDASDCVVEPFCGDSECNGAETCEDCSADCGVCEPTEPEPEEPTPFPLLEPLLVVIIVTIIAVVAIIIWKRRK